MQPRSFKIIRKDLEPLDFIFSKLRVFNLFKVKNDGKYVFRTCSDEPNFMGTFSGTEITIDLEGKSRSFINSLMFTWSFEKTTWFYYFDWKIWNGGTIIKLWLPEKNWIWSIQLIKFSKQVRAPY